MNHKKSVKKNEGMRKVRFEYFQNNNNKNDDEDDDQSRVLGRRKSAAAKATEKKKKNEGSAATEEKMKTAEKKNVQGRSPVPLMLMNFSSQHHLPSASAATTKTRMTEGGEAMIPSLFPSLKLLSNNAKKTRNAKLEFFLGPDLRNGTIGQSLKSLTANLKGEDFFPMNHSRTRSLSPKKLPPFPKLTTDELYLKNNRWPSPLQINGFVKKDETKVLNFEDANVDDRLKLKKGIYKSDKKLNFAKINNHSSATSCSNSMMERLDKGFLESKNHSDGKVTAAATANTSGYRVIKGSKIINVERIHPQQHEAYEISAIDGMIWSKKV